MTGAFLVQARTALSPEWDHGFDEAFAELISSDPDLVRAEFDALVDAGWDEPPPPAAPPPSGPPPAPPAPSAAEPEPGEARRAGAGPDQGAGQQGSPP